MSWLLVINTDEKGFKILKTFLSRPRSRPRLVNLYSRRLETKTLVSRTTSLWGCNTKMALSVGQRSMIGWGIRFPYGGWYWWCRIYKFLIYLLPFCRSSEFNFLTTPPSGRGAPVWSTMVLLDRAMRWYVPIGCRYEPPSYFAPFGRNFAASFDWDCKPPVWREGWS